MASPNTLILRQSPKRESAQHMAKSLTGSEVYASDGTVYVRIYTGALVRKYKKNPQIHGVRRISKKHRLIVRRAYKRLGVSAGQRLTHVP